MVTVAIHQPNYLPWCGYFFKMMHCDVFVILDDVQFSKNSVTNRNKIKGSQGEVVLTVPVKATLTSQINEVAIAERRSLIKHTKSIRACYANAPYFTDYFPTLEEILSRDLGFCDLNEALILQLAKWLGISCNIQRSSEVGVSSGGGQRLVDLVEAVNGNVYLSGSGGAKYQQTSMFNDKSISLQYTNFVSPVYPQMWGEFIPNLSVLDILFNCGEASSDIIRVSKG